MLQNTSAFALPTNQIPFMYNRPILNTENGSNNTEFLFDNYDLPSLKKYTTRKEALDNINKWALLKGYIFSNAPLKKKGKGRVKAIFGCDRKWKKQEERPWKEKGEGRNKTRQAIEYKYLVICI
jgi:hypothetical protein